MLAGRFYLSRPKTKKPKADNGKEGESDDDGKVPQDEDLLRVFGMLSHWEASRLLPKESANFLAAQGVCHRSGDDLGLEKAEAAFYEQVRRGCWATHRSALRPQRPLVERLRGGPWVG